MNKKVITAFVSVILLVTLSGCGSSEESLDTNTVDNGAVDNNMQDNSGMIDNGMQDNSGMVDTTNMSNEERAKLQVDRFVETVNNFASQTPDDDILAVIDSVLLQLSADPEQANVSFVDGVFTTAVGIKYKLNIAVDMVTVGEVVA
jgi:hypothetical protein